MSDYCIVCTPRSGSYYLMEYMCKTFGLAEGNEWFGRNKAVDLSKPFELKQTRSDIDWTVNEDLLTPENIQNRLKHLQNFPVPFCIKAMPLQFTNTVEQVDLPTEERLDFALEILKDFDLFLSVLPTFPSLKNSTKLFRFWSPFQTSQFLMFWGILLCQKTVSVFAVFVSVLHSLLNN